MTNYPGTEQNLRMTKYKLTKIWMLRQLSKKGWELSSTQLSLILSDSYSRYSSVKAESVLVDVKEIIDRYEAAMETDMKDEV